MRLCVFEDRRVHRLEPLALTRPAFDLWCGATTLLRRQQRAFAATQTAALVRPDLAELARLTHAGMAVNDPAWFNGETTIFVNARWLTPDQPIDDVRTPRVGLLDDQVAYAVVPGAADTSAETVDVWLDGWRQTLPPHRAGGVMIGYPWDLVENNAEALRRDGRWFGEIYRGKVSHAGAALIGPAHDFMVHADALVEPLVAADTRAGPVLIDAGAVVQSFSRLEGPCYVGPQTRIGGGKVRGSTFGPSCRIGGEVENSIIQGYSNKYHDGFLGHSYLGEWVNIGAGTQVSDLRNDYGPIKVTLGGERIDTRLTKVGAYLGDHTKTGLTALLNSGTVAGAFVSLLPSGSLLPSVVPSFCTVRDGQIQPRTDLRQMFNTAATVMARRGQELTGTQVDFFFNLFDETAPYRGKVIRDSEQRRLRRSI